MVIENGDRPLPCDIHFGKCSAGQGEVNLDWGIEEGSWTWKVGQDLSK